MNLLLFASAMVGVLAGLGIMRFMLRLNKAQPFLYLITLGLYMTALMVIMFIGLRLHVPVLAMIGGGSLLGSLASALYFGVKPQNL